LGAFRPGRLAVARVLALNSLWLLLARLASQLLGMAFTVLVARSLGQAGLGQYAFISSLVFLANILTTFGTDTLLIREIAASRETKNSTATEALWLQLGLSALAILAIWTGGPLLQGQAPEEIRALQLLSLGLVPLSLYSVCSAALRAHERMDLFLLLSLAGALLQTGGAAAVFQLGGGLPALALALVGTQAAAALCSAWLCRLAGFHFHSKAPAWGTALDLVRRSWPLALLAGTGLLYQRLGILLLGLLAEDAATGWFSAAARVVEGLKMVHLAVLGALFPALALSASRRIGAGSKTTAPSQGETRPRLPLGPLLAYSLLAGAAAWVAAEALVPLLFGPGYLPAAGVLRVLAWSLVPYTFSAVASLELVSRGEEGRVLKATMLALAFAAGLNLLLIPQLGHTGAGLAALAGEVFLALVLSRW
jgi:O-antigen/teichoic acid export membrane protein